MLIMTGLVQQSSFVFKAMNGFEKLVYEPNTGVYGRWFEIN